MTLTLMLETGLAGLEKFVDTIPKPCSSFEPTIHIRSTLSDATQWLMSHYVHYPFLMVERSWTDICCSAPFEAKRG